MGEDSLNIDERLKVLRLQRARYYQVLFQWGQRSRSRPWYKNDKRFVEQRNGALIRRWLGHDRLDSGRRPGWRLRRAEPRRDRASERVTKPLTGLESLHRRLRSSREAVKCLATAGRTTRRVRERAGQSPHAPTRKGGSPAAQ